MNSMTGTPWPVTLSAALRALASEGAEGTRGAGVLARLLRDLAHDLDAQACAVLAPGDARPVVVLCAEGFAAPDLSAAEAARVFAARTPGADLPAGLIARLLPGTTGPRALVLRRQGARPPGPTETRKIDDAAALMQLSLAANAPATGPATDPAVDTAAALQRLTEAQALSVGLINELLAAPLATLDTAIDTALARMGGFCGSDRTYLFTETAPGRISNTHEWCAPGIAPAIADLQDLPATVADPWWPVLERDGQVSVDDVLALPPGDDLRTILEGQGIRSLLVVPLRQDGRVTGFMGYDSVTQPRSFLPGEIYLIRSVAHAIATLLQRRRIEGEMATIRTRENAERRRLSATLDALPDVVVELDADLRITALHANSRTTRPILPAAAVGMRVDQLFPQNVVALARQMQAELETRPTSMGHRCTLNLGGQTAWFSLSAARRAADAPDTAPGYVVVLRDITEQEVQRAEIERLSQIARTTTTLVVITDTEGQIEWVNPAFEARTGYSLDEARGRTPGSLLQCPETDPDTIAGIHAALAAGQSSLCEILNRTKSGEHYWVQLNIQPILDDGGRTTGFMAVQTDITQRREHAARVERALAAEQAARDRLDNAVAILNEALILFDKDQRLVLCNDRFRSLFPALAEHLVPGSTFRDMLVAGVAAGYFPLAGREAEAWIASQVEAFGRRRRLSHLTSLHGRWYRHAVAPTADGGRVAVFSDVTDLKDAETRALADRAMAMDASRDGIALIGPQGTIVYTNAAATGILALTNPQDVIGLNWRDVLVAEGGPEVLEEATRFLQSEGFWQGQLRLIRGAEEPVDVEMSATRNADGSSLCLLRDITERVRARMERERLNEDLALARRREDVSLIAMSLTHDFNNLLTAISAAASLIEEETSAATRGLAETIGTAVDQASGLVRRLMALGRKDNGKAPIDLRAPLNDAATLVRAGLRPPLQLEVTLPDTPVPARADATGIMQMALNLCVNARDALLDQPPQDGPGRIGLTLAPAEGDDHARRFDLGALDPGTTYMRLTIRDNGPGMDAATRAEVFTPYFSTKGDRGTGLGVPIAAEAVRNHGGALSLETTPGQGTMFHVFLPVSAPETGPMAEKDTQSALSAVS